MTRANENLRAALRRLEAGELDALSPQEIDAVEAALSDDTESTERLARVRPREDHRLTAMAASPSADEWNRVWTNIENTVASQRQARAASRTAARVVQFWRASAAVAACVALLLVWRFSPAANSGGSTSVPWDLAVARDVEIHSLETFGSAGAAIQFADDSSGAVVISIFERSDDPGA